MRGTKSEKHCNSHQLRSTYLTSRSSVPRLWCKLQLDFQPSPYTKYRPTLLQPPDYPLITSEHFYLQFWVCYAPFIALPFPFFFFFILPFFYRMKISVQRLPLLRTYSSHPSSHSNCLFICNFPPSHYFSPHIHSPFQKPNLFKTIGIPL